MHINFTNRTRGGGMPLLRWLMLFLLLSPGLFTQAQITITTETGTNFTGGNGVSGSSAVTFVIRNTNPAPFILTGIDMFWQTGQNNTNVVLWHSTTSLGGAVTVAAPTWQTITSAGPIAVASNGYLPTFTGLNFVIPANTTIRFAIESTNGIRYSGTSPIPTPSVFSSNGIDLGVYDADFGNGVIGYGGPFPTPSNNPRAFTGRIHLIPSTACSGTPNGGTANATPTLACQGGTTNLSLTGATVASGITYQWFESSDDVSYSTIVGATTANYTATVNFAGSNYYRCTVTCTNSGQSASSSSVLVSGNAQLSGTYTINNLNPTGGTNFNNFNDAFAALQCGSSGPVTINVTAGQTFTSTGALIANFSGSAANPIVFQRSGVGANPSISFTGTSATTDAGLRFAGADWITWDGIDLLQGGTASTNWVEYGLHLTKATATNGANNNTFRNFTINMGSNTATTVRGVFMENSIAASSAAGASSNNTFRNLTISGGTSAGLWLAGSTTAGNQDVGNSVRNCTISMNSVAAVGYGIYLTGQQDFVVDSNTVGNYALATTSQHNGIYITGTSATTNGVISNNIVEGITNSSAGILYGIQIFNGGAFDINRNTIRNLSSTTTIRGIFLNGVAATESDVHRNRIYGITLNGTSTLYAAGIQSGPGINRLYNNMITGIIANGSSATPGVRGIDVTGGASQAIYNNTVIVGGSSASSAAFAWSTTAISFDVRNNIFINNSTSATFAAAIYRSTAGNPNFAATSGNNLYFSGTPSATRPIYRNATNSVQDITAYLALGVEPVAYTENVQFTVNNGEVAIDQTAITFVESGGQAVALVTNDYYGTARGPYPLAGQKPNGGIGIDVGAEENDFTKNVPATAPDCATLNTPANNTADVCPSTNPTLDWTAAVSGPLPTQGYDVFFGTTNPPAFVANVSTTSYQVSGLSAGTTYYWSVEPKNGAGNATACQIFSFSTTNHAITSTTPGSRCGTGTVNLSATANQGTINWFANATGGASLGTGGSFTTPSISSTTTYYVSTNFGGSTFNTSKVAPEAASTGTVLTTYGQIFTATQAFTLNSVQVFSTTGTAITITLFDATGTTQLQTTGSVPVVAGSSPIIPLGFAIPGAGTYRLAVNGMTGNFIRDNSGVAYPLTLANGIGTIDGFHSSLTGAVTTSASYYFVYNWNVTTGCESNRVPVVASVTPADAINISPSTNNTCPGDQVNLTASSVNTNYSYTWQPGNLTGPFIQVNPTQTTTYVVTGDDGSCIRVDSITITVQPGAVAGTASASDICVSGSTELRLSGSTGNIQWQRWDGTTWVNETGTGSTTANYTVSPTVQTIYRAQVSVVGCPPLFSNSDTVNIINPQIASSAGNTRCGVGPINLSATPVSPATILWYANATGGVPLATGNTYTPNVTTTTSFFAAPFSGSIPTNVGLPAVIGTPSSGSGTTNFGLVFDALAPFTLQQVTVYPVSPTSASGTVTVDIINGSGTVLNTATFNITGSPSGVNPVVLNLNFNVAAGTNLKLRMSAFSGISGMNFQPAAAAPAGNWGYPFVLPGILSINTSTLTAHPTNTARNDLYYYFYNWIVLSGCEGPRTEVIATVNAPDPIVINAPQTAFCQTGNANISVSSTNTNYTYSWSPATGLNTTTGPSVIASPSTTTKYFVTATDGICTTIDSVTITISQPPVAGTATSGDICGSGSTTLFLSGSSGNIQWERFDGSTWVNETGTGATTATYVVSPTVATQYRARVEGPGCPAVFSNVRTVNIFNPAILSTNGGSRCGSGTVNLTATANSGATINWYAAATGGAPIATGGSFSPTVSTTTTYHVSASQGGSTINTSRLAPTTSTGVALTGYTQQFTVNQTVTINSVQVFSTGGTAITITLHNNNGSTLLQSTGSIPVVANSSPNINLGWTITPGTYRLGATAMTGSFIRENPASPGFTYPIALGAFGQIDGFTSTITGTLSTTANTYYYIYNWNVTTGCESARTPVTANVAPATSITVGTPSPAGTVCPGSPVQLSVSSTNSNYSYVWQPGNLTGATVTVNPTDTTRYIVTATDGSCQAMDSVTVNVFQPRGGTASGFDICISGTSTLSLVGHNGSIQWQRFNGSSWVNETGTGSTTASYVVSPPSAVTQYRAQVTLGSCNPVFSNTVTINTINPTVVSASASNMCGPGNANLNATASAGSSILWYSAPTGGTPLATTSTFSTAVTTDTIFYAAATSGSSTINTSRLAPTTSTGVALTGYTQQFTVNQTVTINSVQVFSTGGTAITITLHNNDGSTLLQSTGSVPVVANSSPNINLGWTITPGTYRLGATAMTGSFIRENPASPGFTYPIALGTFGQINGFTSSIGGALTTTANTYYYIYNWNISIGCVSARTPVAVGISSGCSTPVNDACVDASVLPLATTINASTFGSTASGGNTTCSASGTLNDVWYSFNSGPNTRATIQANRTSSTGSYGIALYSACGTQSTNPVFCQTSSGSINQMVSGLAENTNYLVRVYSVAGSEVHFNLNITGNGVPGVALRAEDCGKTDFAIGGPAGNNNQMRVEPTGNVNDRFFYQILNASGNTQLAIITRNGRNTRVLFEDFPGVFQYGNTYNVRVVRGNQFTIPSFNSAANCVIGFITAPAPVQVGLTQIAGSACSSNNYTLAPSATTNTNGVDGVNHFNASPVTSATAYDFEVSDANANVLGIISTNLIGRVFVSNHTALFSYGNTYSIRVRARIGTTIGDWGTSCTIGFIADPGVVAPVAPQLLNCTMTDVTAGTRIFRTTTQGATFYVFHFYNDAAATSLYASASVRASNQLFAGDVTPGLLPSTTYYVRVEAIVGGISSGLGNICELTTAGVVPRFGNVDLNAGGIFGLNAYPNPFAGNTTVVVSSSDQAPALLNIYDLAGKLISSRQVPVNQTLEMGDGLAAGHYVLEAVRANGDKATFRLAKTN